MEEAKKIIKEILQKRFHPIYLLSGEEPYFIDLIAEQLEKNVLEASQRTFNQTIVYGRDISIENLLGIVSRYPVMSDRQLVVVREAQQLARIERLEFYAAKPAQSTVLVLCYKYKKIDSRLKLVKNCQTTGLVFESKKMYENQTLQWLREEIETEGHTAKPEALRLLIDAIGFHPQNLKKELERLFINIPPKAALTPDIIETYVGVSREYNDFELQKAIAENNRDKTMKIVNYFIQNPKSAPVTATVSKLATFFINLLKYQGLIDKSKSNASKELGISPYFLEEYEKAAGHFPMKKVSQIINALKTIDLNSKGVESGSMTHSESVKNLIISLFF